MFYVWNMGLQSKDDFLWVLLTHSPIYMMALWKVNLSVFPALCSKFQNMFIMVYWSNLARMSKLFRPLITPNWLISLN